MRPTRTVAREQPPPLVGGEREIGAIVEAVRTGWCCRFVGARYHHKSMMMQEACRRVDAMDGHIGLYVRATDLMTGSEEMFYESLRKCIARKAWRDHHLHTPRTRLCTSRDLTRFLIALPTDLGANVALFVDDLEMAPAEFVTQLLLVLRAAHQATASRLRLLAVVCASNSLARTALGPTSPFENISHPVVVGDLSRAETLAWARGLAAGEQRVLTTGALEWIYDQTSGDRFLVTEVCRACFKYNPARITSITRRSVDRAVQQWLRTEARRAVAEGLLHIGKTPEILLATLKLIQDGHALASQLPLDLSQVPDPLTTSGFVAVEGNQYRIKSALHRTLLQQHFTPEQVGRIMFSAGEWERSIAHLSMAGQPTPDGRERILLPGLNAMYSVESKRAAYRYFALGLVNAYPGLVFKLYDFNPVQNCLVAVEEHPGQSCERPNRIAHNSPRSEIKALNAPHEYWLQVTDRYREALLIPLRTRQGEPLGLLVAENFVTPQTVRRRHDEIMELTGYAQHAARALKNREIYEGLNRVNAWRARNLQRLLGLTRKLMSKKAGFRETLHLVLRSALQAVGRHGQMGSIYLYNHETGMLTMEADTGYPPTVASSAKFHPGEGLAGHVFSTRQSYVVNDTRFDLHYAPILAGPPAEVRSSIGVPLLGARGPFGVLCLDNLNRANVFDEEDRHLLELYAGQVALWLENVRLLEALRSSRETALLATRLLHQITGSIPVITSLSNEIAAYAPELEAVQTPVSELREAAQLIDYVGRWLDKYVQVGTLQLEQVRIPVLLDSVIDRLDHERPPLVRVERHYPETRRVTPVRADPSLITILIENLLRNAYDALRGQAAGRVVVQYEGQASTCLIRIGNDGPCIPRASRKKIWKPGWTTKADVAGRYGRGLGLSLCRQIATAHDGTLVLDERSKLCPTMFVLRLPVHGPACVPE